MEERARVLEIKFDAVEEEILETKENMKRVFEKERQANKDLNTIVMKLENEITKIKKILEKTVRKTELDELENYVELLSPIKSQFVTKKEVEEIVEEKLKS